MVWFARFALEAWLCSVLRCLKCFMVCFKALESW